MKEPLFFHVQPKVEQATVMFADGSMAIMDIFEDIRPHTYCIKKSEKQDNLLSIGTNYWKPRWKSGTAKHFL